jgi:hypothetical protein
MNRINRMMQIAPRALMLVPRQTGGLLVIKEGHVAPFCGPDIIYLPVPKTEYQQGWQNWI